MTNQLKGLLILFFWAYKYQYSVSSFVHPHQYRQYRHNNNGNTATTTFAFSWFKDSKDSNSSQDDTDDANSELDSDIETASNINIIQRFKTSQRIGEQSGAALQELSATLVEGTSGDGNVKVTFNGQQMPVAVEIDESYLKNIASQEGTDGVDKLCLALTDAMQSAHYLSKIQLEEKMQTIYKDLGL